MLYCYVCYLSYTSFARTLFLRDISCFREDSCRILFSYISFCSQTVCSTALRKSIFIGFSQQIEITFYTIISREREKKKKRQIVTGFYISRRDEQKNFHSDLKFVQLNLIGSYNLNFYFTLYFSVCFFSSLLLFLLFFPILI